MLSKRRQHKIQTQLSEEFKSADNVLFLELGADHIGMFSENSSRLTLITLNKLDIYVSAWIELKNIMFNEGNGTMGGT